MKGSGEGEKDENQFLTFLDATPVYIPLTALTKISDGLLTTKSKSLYSVLLLFDLSAAFDTIALSILPEALHYLGLHGFVLIHFSSYLSNCMFSVSIREGASSSLHQSIRDPQSSVLALLLFSLLTLFLADPSNPMAFNITFTLITQLYLTSSELSLTIQSCISNSNCLSDVSA